jgi:acyl-CoA thioester hydrolase
LKHYTKTIVVKKEDLDDLDHVNNVRYLEWVQDIAKEHWQTEATTEMLDKYIWMVRSNYIEYKGQAFLGETLYLKTFIKDAHGPISVRVVEIHNQENKLILRSTADWCLIDRTSKRVIRLTKELTNLFT